MKEKDTFYDYRKFEDNRAHHIFTQWDGRGGNHELILKHGINLLKGRTVLDVGCGLCHLYDLIKDRIDEYVGMDIDERVVAWAQERYPHLRIEAGSVYNLSGFGTYDTVYGLGLYRGINETKGIEEMLKHTNEALILTYHHRGDESEHLPDPLWSLIRGDEISSVEIIANRIVGTDILRLNK